MLAKHTLWMCVALAAAILAAFLVVVLATPTKPAEAAFPGQNGKIAFVSDLGDREILTMNANGDNKTNLTNNRARDEDPAFSANGKKIAFTNNRSGNLDIFTMSATGTHQNRVTTGESREGDPAWSPDGTKIAFERKRGSDSTFGIFVMKAAPESATNRPKLISGNQVDSDSPDWQPLP
jgi:TolB protein